MQKERRPENFPKRPSQAERAATEQTIPEANHGGTGTAAAADVLFNSLSDTGGVDGDTKAAAAPAPAVADPVTAALHTVFAKYAELDASGTRGMTLACINHLNRACGDPDAPEEFMGWLSENFEVDTRARLTVGGFAKFMLFARTQDAEQFARIMSVHSFTVRALRHAYAHARRTPLVWKPPPAHAPRSPCVTASGGPWSTQAEGEEILPAAQPLVAPDGEALGTVDAAAHQQLPGSVKDMAVQLGIRGPVQDLGEDQEKDIEARRIRPRPGATTGTSPRATGGGNKDQY